MTDAARWARLRERFEELCDLSEGELGERLGELERQDPELHREVRSLLASDRATDTLAPIRLVSTGVEAADPLLGRRLGAWTVERRLGEGGMGRVYLARRADLAFDKAVALKVLRGGLDTARLRDRFARERRIVAALEHPGIARLLDGGETEEGLPYLVLEYVEGTDLVGYCRERSLGLGARLGLFRKVLEAVAAAHRRLVVHRDLKPSNILVTAEGEPKLLDFGIAKLVEPEADLEAATRTSERLLTPAYASPEQIRGEPVTTGTDVYSLGVVLYELVTGRTPFEESTSAAKALSRAITEREPERPSAALARRGGGPGPVAAAEVRGDLDAILLRALRPRPEERYRSVEELAADLDRFVAGRPVEARRGTLRYRAGKFLGRHRLGLAAAALAALALGLTVTFYTVSLRAARDRAERRFEETRALARALLFELHDAIRDVDGATAARRLLLETGLRYLERLRAESAGDAALTREVAQGYLRIGEILSDRRAAAGLEMSGQSAPLLEIARQLVEPQLAAADNLEDRRLMVRILGAIARRRFESELEPAARLEAARRAVALADEIAREQTANAEDFRALAAALRDEVDLLGFSGRIAEAGEPVTLARAASARAAELAPGDRGTRLDRAASELAFGRVMFRLERGPEALEAFAMALGILEELAREEPRSVEIRDRLASVLATSGSHAWQSGRPGEGVALLERAERLHAEIAAADPENHQARRRLSSARTELAVAMIAAGRYDEAVARHGEALETLDRAAQRPGAPAFLIYERAFLQSHLAAAARVAAAVAPAGVERDRWLARARSWYGEALRLHREGQRAGIESHLEPETWDRIREDAAELGVS